MLNSVYCARLSTEIQPRSVRRFNGLLSYREPSHTYHQLGNKRCFGSFANRKLSRPLINPSASQRTFTTSATSSNTNTSEGTVATDSAVNDRNDAPETVQSNIDVDKSPREKVPKEEGSKQRQSKDEKKKESTQSNKKNGPPKKKKKPEGWKIQKDALKHKFKEGWNPPKKLSPDALEGIRHLHATAPDQFPTPVLAEQFKVSPEAIRRILKSKWRPSEKEMEDRRGRWQKRYSRIWSQMSELGLRPKRKSAERISDPNRVLYENRNRP